MKRYRRERNGKAAAAVACLITSAALIATPFALWGWGVMSGENAACLGVATTFGAIFAVFCTVMSISDAWDAHKCQCSIRDHAEWDEWQAQRLEMERILREEGLK